MKLYKSILAAMMAVVAAAGFTACDDDLDYPPVVSPDLGGKGAWDAPLTVNGARAYYTAYYSDAPDTGKNYWVTGFIVGAVETTETVFTATDQTVNMTGNFTTPNNILLAATPDETNYENCIALQLPSGPVRSGLNLQDNPGNLGKEVSVYGYIDKYLGLAGMRSLVAFNWGSQGIDTGEIETGKSDYTLATAITSGRCYALVANNSAAQTVTAAGGNGFLYTDAVTIVGSKFNANEQYGFLFTETAPGADTYYISDYKGRFFYQDTYGSGWSNRPSVADRIVKDSKQFVWQVVKGDGNAWLISNTASGSILAYDTNYSSYGIYANLSDQYLAPALYEMANDPVTVPDFTPADPAEPTPGPTEGEGDGTLASPYNVAAALSVINSGSIPSTEVYVTGIIASIKEIDTSSYGNATYFISDDGTSATVLEIYRGYGLDGAKFTSGDEIKVGDKVVILGKLVMYNTTPEVTTGSKIVSINGQGGSQGGDEPAPTPDPEPQGSEIYTGLVDNADDWTFDNVNLPEGATYIWAWKVYNGSGYLNGSAYVGGALESEAYAIREFDLSAYKSVSLSFEHAAKFQTTLRDLCGLCVRVKGTTEWQSVAIPAWPEAGSWTFVNSGDIDLSAFAGKSVEIAFKYGSTTSGADTWEIKNLIVNASK